MYFLSSEMFLLWSLRVALVGVYVHACVCVWCVYVCAHVCACMRMCVCVSACVYVCLWGGGMLKSWYGPYPKLRHK